MERLATEPSLRPEIGQETINPGIAVHVSGELDLASVGDLEERIASALSRDAAPILIDLTDCGFIDSSVISVLVSLRRRLGNSSHPRFAVVASDQPLQVLRLTGLDRQIAVFAHRGEALSALRGDDAAQS